MAIQAGTYRLGPDDGTLSVRTKRGGAAAKAGHDLLLHVTSWEATIEVGANASDSTFEIEADGGSLRVVEGTGGIQALGDDDKENIEQTIDEDVLKQQRITFQSSQVQSTAGGSGLNVRGDLTLAGTTHPIEFDVEVDEAGKLGCVAVIKQSEWGIKPYSALFGALKVLDEVEVALAGFLPGAES